MGRNVTHEASSLVSVMGVPFGAETATSSPIALSGLGAARAEWAASNKVDRDKAEKATIVSYTYKDSFSLLVFFCLIQTKGGLG